MADYKIINGTAYDAETPNGVIMALEGARQHGHRIRIFYGDAETGRSWMDEWDTMGTVGRSTGDYKIPLLLPRKTSIGGHAILLNAIVRITEARGGKVLYTHTSFHCPPLIVGQYRGKWAALDESGAPHATFTTETQAQRWIDYVAGRRNNK